MSGQERQAICRQLIAFLFCSKNRSDAFDRAACWRSRLDARCPNEYRADQKVRGVLATIDGRIELKKDHKSAIENLFKSLLHSLMTGKVRVPLRTPGIRTAADQVGAGLKPAPTGGETKVIDHKSQKA